MTSIEMLKLNLLSPIVLAFLLGAIAKLVKSELSLPKELYDSLSIYLLLALGLKGGVELSHSSFDVIAFPVVASVALGIITPISAYFLMRKIGKMSGIDAAALAAHYGSVSAVTFIAANQFVSNIGFDAEGFMPALVTFMESPGILVGLAIGAIYKSKRLLPNSESIIAPLKKDLIRPQNLNLPKNLFHEIFTSRSMLLMVGGLIIGFLGGAKAYEPVKPFFDTGFKGALVLFMLEMGIVAASRVASLKKVGFALTSLALALPILHGFLGVLFGTLVHLSVGGAAVLGAITGSASYIAAPPAVRMTLPEANPTYYLTASLVVTFPFNLAFGIPLFFKMARLLHG